MQIRKHILFILFSLLGLTIFSLGQPKGSLFIIGGGERSPDLTKELVSTANLRPGDYIAVLTMATSLPEQSTSLISNQLSEFCKNRISTFNFTKEQANDDLIRIDSVRNARLVYITGGDQNKFMNVVHGSKLYEALHYAYKNGATISGTSAGAAVMSKIMITGSQKETGTAGDFKVIKKGNVITAEGMGLLTNTIIDQHFIMRSRYNRLLSVLGDYPDKMVVGIDESTAIVVKNKIAKVIGQSQVVVISNPKKIKTFNNNKLSFKNARFSLYMPGEQFAIN
jgi:cyanophycinase